MKIYVASSWKNEYQPKVVEILREHGHEVYDFRNPTPQDSGFQWDAVASYWRQWNNRQFREALQHPLAEKAFQNDFSAMQWADVILAVMPFGNSTSLELGWGAGNGKKTILLLNGHIRPELMVKMVDYICLDLNEVLFTLGNRLW